MSDPRTVIVGLDQSLFNLRDLSEKQSLKVAMKMLNNTARSMHKAETEHLKAIFDRPVPFTLKAMAFTQATKTNMVSSVFVKETQAKYLAAQVDGGTRAFKSFEERFDGVPGVDFVMPGKGAKLNQFGNVSKAMLLKIAKAVKSSNHGGYAVKHVSGRAYSVHPKPGITGVLAPALLFFATSAKYQPRFKFHEIGVSAFRETYAQHFADAWNAALAALPVPPVPT